MTLLVVLFFLVMLFLGAPLYTVLAGLALYFFSISDIPPMVVVNEMYRLTDQEIFITLPLFAFAGVMMSETGMPRRLLQLTRALLGWAPGGMAIVATLVDAAQSAGHRPIDVGEIGCDFLAFSGHKMCGPTGIGVLYGKMELLKAMPPFLGGGDMIRSVSFAETTYADPPHRFEAGTPPIVEAIGLGAAIDYVNAIGQDAIAAHEAGLLAYATERLSQVDGLTIIGTAKEKAAIISFVLDGIHPHDIGTIVDRQGVAIRAGHHCAQPVMQRFGVDATARASFGLYNTREEADALVTGLRRVQEIFA